MSDLAIGLDGVGKQYRLSHQSGQRYIALRDVLTEGVSRSIDRLWGRAAAPSSDQDGAGPAPDAEPFWALRDISAEIRQGEVVGIIGRNGAGKSTLLKILSRVTQPTTGRLRIRGRLASLLEVGTGFHPELSGRENIFLNGSILGMTRSEILKKFDEIVAFAEVERFLDTPVKRYSSGMYVRLAFAVAAHLDSEILVVDEVLAVGDADFQKKCLGRMEDVGRQGQTVLLVSHNLLTIQTLCKRCLLLDHGRLAFDSNPAEAVRHYLGTSTDCSSFQRKANADGSPTLVGATLVDIGSPDAPSLRLDVEVASRTRQRVGLDFRLKDAFGMPVAFGGLGTLNPGEMIPLTPPLTRLSLQIDGSRLANGSYHLSMDLVIPGLQYFDRIEDCLSFELSRVPVEMGSRALPQGWHYGSMELSVTAAESGQSRESPGAPNAC